MDRIWVACGFRPKELFIAMNGARDLAIDARHAARPLRDSRVDLMS